MEGSGGWHTSPRYFRGQDCRLFLHRRERGGARGDGHPRCDHRLQQACRLHGRGRGDTVFLCIRASDCEVAAAGSGEGMDISFSGGVAIWRGA